MCSSTDIRHILMGKFKKNKNVITDTFTTLQLNIGDIMEKYLTNTTINLRAYNYI